MEQKISPKKRVVVAVWKNQNKQSIEVFSNLKVFCASYPKYNYNTLNNYLGKAKSPYKNHELQLTRQEVFSKPILKKVRSIQAVVTRYEQAAHDEGEQNLDFWLAAEPETRIYAVTKLASEGIPNDTKMDKQVVQKFKLKG
jgi:hypothetical protein